MTICWSTAGDGVVRKMFSRPLSVRLSVKAFWKVPVLAFSSMQAAQ